MKRCIAILFLSIFAMSSTEVHQLLRIPYVFKHFAKHQQQNTDLSFIQFLDMHYMHGSPRDNDYEEDMKLPFKSNECSYHVSLSPVYILPINISTTLKPLELPSYKPTFQKDFCIPSGYNSCIWQPPKLS